MNSFILIEAANHEKDILLLNQGLAVLRMPVDPRGGRSYIIHFEAFMTAVGELRLPTQFQPFNN